VFDRSKLYSNFSDFYEKQGNNVMKLTPDAAKKVCCESVKHNLIVSRIEGGIWHDPGFEMRLDCIWDRDESLDGCPILACKAANKFITEKAEKYDVFIVSLQVFNHG